jgi:predicted ATPase
MPELVRHIAPKNFLSFGPDNLGIQLRPLNLLIGPNGSGKSNLIEAINFMRFAPKEFRDVTRKGGGVGEWIWKGDANRSASVEWAVDLPYPSMPVLLHLVVFGELLQSFSLVEEYIGEPTASPDEPRIAYQYLGGQSVTYVRNGEKQTISRDSLEADRSILGQRRDPDSFPEVTGLALIYEKIRIYREWSFGRNAVFREPQKADLRNDSLDEDFGNLGLFLNAPS